MRVVLPLPEGPVRIRMDIVISVLVIVFGSFFGCGIFRKSKRPLLQRIESSDDGDDRSCEEIVCKVALKTYNFLII